MIRERIAIRMIIRIKKLIYSKTKALAQNARAFCYRYPNYKSYLCGK
ncbi:hypothetical protein CLOBY_10460 [Clostridium saccharobutylicum]|nr:hypothetical protein CLOBY_10460 [Clostridium saccharobutylicum]NSB90638.1 hypothetical protein [Clostridium saccharobutylicum]NYC28721.1 hypothetical protein [Clostridium saccharobutylicum]OOM18902.1 hypothetical protein CLSAB_02530 [Clostridium saccharobutylicum]